MPDVFISYSHKDGEYAHRLAEELRRQQLDVWIDDRIDYGDQWPRVIQENLAACRVFIVIMSTNAFNSMWVQNEVSYAQGHNKPIFPMLLEGRVWLSLAALQYADVRTGEMPPAKFAERIKRALGLPVPTAYDAQTRETHRTRSRKPRWGLVTGSLVFLAVAAGILYAALQNRAQGAGIAPDPTQPTAMEAPATEEPTTPEPIPAEFTSKDFHLAVGDVRTYKFGLASERAEGIVQELGEVTESIVALEEGSNALMEIFRVERTGDAVGLACGGEASEGQIKIIWYIRDETRLFTACDEEQKAVIVDALLRERLIAGAAPPPELSAPSYLFPIVLSAKWNHWAGVPVEEDGSYGWIVDQQLEQKSTFAGTFNDCYAVGFRTNPDATFHYICRGMGLVGWFYSHLGTLDDYSGELWSYSFSP